jgi:hypothetical protein
MANAARATDFINSMGVDAQYGGSGLNDPNAELQSLQYLGIHHVRQGIQYAGNLTGEEILARAGVQFDTGVTNNGQDVASSIAPGLANLDQLQQAVPGSVFSIEGPNEANDPTNGVTYNGASFADGGTAAAAQQALWNAVKADPNLAGVKVLDQSISEGPSNWQSFLQAEGNLSAYADSSNIHTYPNNGDQPGVPITSDMGNNDAVVPGKAATITEIGYDTDQSVAYLGVDATTQANNVLNTYAEAFKDGVAQTYIYSLYDNSSGSWGLFQGDGSTAKQSATDIHNMTSILADSGSNSASFQAGSLNYSISNESSTTKDFLLEKSNGAFDIVVFDEQKDYNGNGFTPGTENETVNLGATYAQVEVFDPTQGSSAVQTLTNVSQVQLGMTDHPLIVQVEPQGSAPPPPPPPPANESSSGTVVTTDGPTIEDSHNQAWTIVGGIGQPASEVALNGTADTSTGYVNELAYVNHTLWQQNTAGWWYSWQNPGWSTGTQTSPLPAPPTTMAAQVKITTADTSGPAKPGFAASTTTGSLSSTVNQVLQTSPGADILLSGKGNDTLLAQATSKDGWASFENFHHGDVAMILGVDPQVARLSWVAGADLKGNAGATLDVDLKGSGHVDAAVTFQGVSLAAAKSFVEQYGTMGNQPYLAIHG